MQKLIAIFYDPFIFLSRNLCRKSTNLEQALKIEFDGHVCKSKTHKINLLFNLHLKRRIRPRVSRFCVCLQSENNTNILFYGQRSMIYLPYTHVYSK